MTTRAHSYERSHRYAPRQSFSGGHIQHGQILPQPQPSLLAKIFGRNAR